MGIHRETLLLKTSVTVEQHKSAVAGGGVIRNGEMSRSRGELCVRRDFGGEKFK